MSTLTAIAAIKARLIANWTTTAIAWPKEPFDPPADACWLFFDPDDTQEGRVGMGSINNPRGYVNIHVMTPSDANSDDYAASLRESLSAIFANKQFSSVTTDVVANISNSGSSEDKSYSMSTVRIEWGQLHNR